MFVYQAALVDNIFTEFITPGQGTEKKQTRTMNTNGEAYLQMMQCNVYMGLWGRSEEESTQLSRCLDSSGLITKR